MPRFPRLQSNHDLIAALRSLRQLRARRELNVNIVNKTWIIRDDVIKVPRVLKRAHDRIARAFQDSDNASFRAFAARGRFIAGYARDHAVAVHGRAGVFGRDKNIWLSGSFGVEKSVSRLVDRDGAGDEVSFGGQDIPIFSNARYFS